eukprot:TRINITY_DN6649_c0_g1_i1.p1 TRINITY_DN6649_c0_g1~~TRINITY_DN6649_c0_g1_i1.p1  ORF type:complete len:149 (+),score=14.07 TRINITY_DN6649_c0_g1_i1:510-956(+)
MENIKHTGDGTHIFHYCPFPIAAYRNFRYYIIRQQNQQFWVDVSRFDNKNNYIIATLEQDLNCDDKPDPCMNVMVDHSLSASKVIAYFHFKECTDLINATPYCSTKPHGYRDVNPFKLFSNQPEYEDFTQLEELEIDKREEECGRMVW